VAQRVHSRRHCGLQSGWFPESNLGRVGGVDTRRQASHRRPRRPYAWLREWQHMLGLPTVVIDGDTATARTDLP
jgi:hypothetical protein